MTILSRRIRRETDKAVDELQAKIVLKKGQKTSKDDLIEKAVYFARKNEKRFIQFVVSPVKENNEDTVDPLEFILKSVKGGQPKDYTVYNYDDF